MRAMRVMDLLMELIGAFVQLIALFHIKDFTFLARHSI